jgi:hypothetical protein
MNAVTLALKTAGVVVPSVMKRVWMFLKDKPGQSAKAVDSVLKLGTVSLSKALWDLERRGMVTVKPVPKRIHTVTGSRIYSVKEYSAVGAEYELLPVPSTKRTLGARCGLVCAAAAPGTSAPVTPVTAYGPDTFAINVTAPLTIPVAAPSAPPEPRQPSGNSDLADQWLALFEAVSLAGGNPRAVLSSPVKDFVTSMNKNGYKVCLTKI